MNEIIFSVVICTYNRSHYLKRVLEKFPKVNFSIKSFELIIIDNNSTDDTKDVCNNFRNRYSQINFHYCFEKKQGLSIARNIGINLSKGKFVVFLDDDALVDKDWLNALFGTFENHNADVVGGKVELLFENEKPQWLENDLLIYLSHLDWSNEEIEIDLQKQWLVGANIAFKKSIFTEYKFLTILGRNGKTLLSGEETEICQRIQNKGGIIYFSPKAIVHHIVLPDRLMKNFFIKRFYYGAFSNAISEYLRDKSKKYIIKRLLRKQIHFIWNFIRIIFNKKNKIFRLYLNFSDICGYYKGFGFCIMKQKNQP